MTVPTGIPSPMTLEDRGALRFPLGWLLARASVPIQFRASVDVAQLPAPPGSPLRTLPYAHPPALALAVRQGGDGTWSRAMLAGPGGKGDGFDSVGTIPALRRLIEYGWEGDTPPLLRARRPLFRLLAEDADAAFAYELAPTRREDAPAARRARAMLREAAAAALAQGGHEKDPRLRGAAVRLLHRLEAFLARGGHVGSDPDELPPPTAYSLLMLAHMPVLRREWAETVAVLAEWLSQPAEGTPPRDTGTAPLLHGDPLADDGESDIGWTLAWLELAARMGMLRPGTVWMRAFERLVDDCDGDGVWHPRRAVTVARSTNAFIWPSWTLEPQLNGDARLADVTFRIGLIGRLAGWRIELA